MRDPAWSPWATRLTAAEIAYDLRRSGYTESKGNPIGWFRLSEDQIEIFPGTDSFSDQEAAKIRFSKQRISRIVSLSDTTERNQLQLNPSSSPTWWTATAKNAGWCAIRAFPKSSFEAVTSIEDKRFFHHAGFDPLRIVKAVLVDIKEGRKEQGASTLSQQLARMFWLYPEKRWSRKLAELLITLQLEQRLSKDQIFEYYANQIYLGRRGSFNIHGFGEGAEAYFGKDIRQLTLPEAAALAGMIQRPGYYDPFRHPQRVRDRRNIVLALMRQNGHITDRDYALAIAAPLNVSRAISHSLDAPYFVAIVDDTLEAQFQDYDFQSNAYRIYTTIDLDLQRAASEAISIGIQQVDERIRKQRRFRNQTPPVAQVALVAIDPHTGDVKALIGGRNYGASQLNRALARRQPGSIFKPFVFATALDTAIQGGPTILTAASTVLDEPTTFWYDERPYEPTNFKSEYHGLVSFRQALAKSMNVATVRIAEMVGYDHVVDLARESGLNYQIKPTPAVALGAYEVSPLEMAGAYTIFANDGIYLKPGFISMVRSQNGEAIYARKLEEKRVLDPRVAYLMTNLMEEVMRSGTAAGVRARGYKAPAAGKTGTSHDGWFAGYTSELLCIVWVGFDDNRPLELEGAHSALPIWTEFMKRAMQYRPYRSVKPFRVPDGIVAVQIDPASGMPATRLCPGTRVEMYVAGTQPVGSCSLHGGHPEVTNVGWEMPAPQLASQSPQVHPPAPSVSAVRSLPPAEAEERREEAADPPKEKKKGFFRRLWGVLK